ncbi:MAG: cation diffusion facilitator family transporter [Candidatus Omnitrophica bacterium]|nr:cation diffusion facilitator family transporter [Candidatus Omnitrophota bacterium]
MDSPIQAHYSKIRRVLVIVLILNWLVAAAKIIYGLITHCSSMTADGFHSLADGTSNVIGLVGIHLAGQPTDEDHPYGHKKYETLFSLIIAALLFLVAFNLGKEGVMRLHHPAMPVIDIASFAIMLLTLSVNIAVMTYEQRKGKSLKSDILVSDAMHTRADIMTSLSVIAALIFMKMGFAILDPIVTILISLFIAYAGFQILKESSNVLVDSAAILNTKRIEDIVFKIKGVKNCHKIRTRGRPDDIHIDLHVQVSGQMHVDNAHKICYAIEEAIKKGIPEVTDVVVHIEPREDCAGD